MDGKNRLVGIGYALAQSLDELAELAREVIADGIGNIHGARTGVDHRL